MNTDYDHQAQSFLTSNGLRLRATLSDSKPCPWRNDGAIGKHGAEPHHYRITISRPASRGTVLNSKDQPFRSKGDRLTFDFWDSIANAEKDAKPTAYDVLACISSDAHCPDTFNEWCSEYGEDSDSIRARQTFNRCNAFARRLRAFFTPAELAQLTAIQ